jgi:hypothetical protein
MKYSRVKDNLKILKRLETYIKKNPDQRFGQVLRNAGVVIDYFEQGQFTPRWSNHFNEEPANMLIRMRERRADK